MPPFSLLTAPDSFEERFEVRVDRGFKKNVVVWDESVLGDNDIEMVFQDRDDPDQKQEFQLQLAQEAFDRGIHHYSESEFSQAMTEFQRSLEIREDTRGRLDPDTAKSYLWVGTIHYLLNEPDKALDDFDRAYRIKCHLRKKQMEQGLPVVDDVGIVTNWINRALGVTPRYQQAKKLYWRQLESCIEHEHQGDSWRSNNHFQRAIESYRTALQFEYHRRGLKPNSAGRPLLDAADLYVKIAECYEDMNNLDRAVVEYRNAFIIYMDRLGGQAEMTIHTRDALSRLACARGFRDEVALTYADSIYTAICRERRGDLYAENKEYSVALAYYAEALQIEGANVGHGQVACAMLYLKIGQIQATLGQQEAAMMSFCRAVGIFERILGNRHRYTTSTIKLIQTLCCGSTNSG